MATRPGRTLGPGHDDFWRWCADDELRLPRCGGCGRLAWPIVAACTQCGGEDWAWERMSGEGRLASWCTFERDYYAGALPMPWEVILVALDEGPLFIANPAGFGNADAAIDMPVRLTFIDAEDEAGPFRLPVFARA